MPVRMTTTWIDAGYPFPSDVDSQLLIEGRRGIGNVTGNSVAFGIEYPLVPYPGASKVMTGKGTWNGADGTRINFQQYFQYRCFGLLINQIDDQTVNWDTVSGRTNPTPVVLAGTYDAGGFYMYQRYMQGSVVRTPGVPGTYAYSYAAYGI